MISRYLDPAILREIFRYYAVGTLINLLGYVAFLLLIYSGLEAKFAASILYVVGAVVSFYANRRLVFDSGVRMGASLFRLILMLLLGYGINMAVLHIFVDKMRFEAWMVQLFCVALVSVFFYLVNKFYVHRKVSS